MSKDIRAWLRRQRICNRRLALLDRVCAHDVDVLAIAWLDSRPLLFGGISALFQLAGIIAVLTWLLYACLQFPTLSYWWGSAAVLGCWILSFLAIPRHATGLWAIGLISFHLAALVFVADFAVASLRTPQQITAPIVDRDCYTPARGKGMHTPKRRCEVEIQVGWYTHLIDVTDTGLWMNSAIPVDLRSGFLGVDYPRLGQETAR